VPLSIFLLSTQKPLDVKKLVADNSTLSEEALNNILRDYNTEQMIAAPLPGTKYFSIHTDFANHQRQADTG
jgi:hypothetical protein